MVSPAIHKKHEITSIVIRRNVAFNLLSTAHGLHKFFIIFFLNRKA